MTASVPTEFRRMTPPKYAAALEDRMALLTLEQRLAAFIDWMNKEKGVVLAHKKRGESPVPLRRNEVVAMVEEYING